MIVYVEVAILENLIINLFLLSACAKFFKIKQNFAYLFLGATIGVAFALVLPLVKCGKIITLLIKILAGGVVVYFSFFPKSTKKLLRLTFCFIALTFVLGGAIYAVFDVLKINLKQFVGTSKYSVLPVLLIMLSAFVFYKLANKLIKLIYSNIKVAKHLFKVKIKANGKSLSYFAFYDSGNTLKDYRFNLPVCVVSLCVFEKLFPNESIANLILKREINGVCGHYITYNTISTKEEKMFAFKPQSVEIYNGKKWIKADVVLGVSLKNISKEGNFEVLLNSLCEV